jgi:hypothetical protein
MSKGPSSPDYMAQPPGEYRGSNSKCFACGEEKVEWHGLAMCILCDNPTEGFAAWFDDFTTGLPADEDEA